MSEVGLYVRLALPACLNGAFGPRYPMKNRVGQTVCEPIFGGQVPNIGCQPAADWKRPLGPACPWRGKRRPAFGGGFSTLSLGPEARETSLPA